MLTFGHPITGLQLLISMGGRRLDLNMRFLQCKHVSNSALRMWTIDFVSVETNLIGYGPELVVYSHVVLTLALVWCWWIFMVSVLDPFPTVLEPKVVRPVVGTALKLGCEPPDSYPTGEITWGLETPGTGVETVAESDRISVDYHGNQNVQFQQHCDSTRQHRVILHLWNSS